MHVFLFKNALVRCQTELNLEKQKTVHVWEKETAMQSRQKELESKLEEKQKDIERLEKMLELIKTECNAQVSEKVRARSAESGLHYLLYACTLSVRNCRN